MNLTNIINRQLELFARAYAKYKKDGAKNTIIAILKYTGVFEFHNLLFSLLNFFTPKDQTIWIFSSKYGFSENSKYLFLYVNDNCSDITPVWISKNKEVASRLTRHGYDAYYTWSILGIMKQLQANVSFFTHGSGHQIWGAFYPHSKRILLSHASHHIIGLKPNNTKSTSLIEKIKYDYTYTLIAGSDRQPNVYDTYQPPWYKYNADDLLPLGYPKNDALYKSFTEEYIGSDVNLIREIEQRSQNASIVFYMPTKVQTPHSSKDNPLIDNTDNLMRMDDLLEEYNSHMYIKLHPKDPTPTYDTNKLNNIHIINSAIDVYPLLRSADVFISDYSSTLIDTFHLDIPKIHFVYDLKDKGPEKAFDRFGFTRRGGLSIKYSEVKSGPICKDIDELFDQIQHSLCDSNTFSEERNHIKELYFDHHDGESSERITNKILSEVELNGPCRTQ